MAIVISNIDCNGILDFKVIKLKDALFHSNIPLDQYVYYPRMFETHIEEDEEMNEDV